MLPLIVNRSLLGSVLFKLASANKSCGFRLQQESGQRFCLFSVFSLDLFEEELYFSLSAPEIHRRSGESVSIGMESKGDQRKYHCKHRGPNTLVNNNRYFSNLRYFYFLNKVLVEGIRTRTDEKLFSEKDICFTFFNKKESFPIQ